MERGRGAVSVVRRCRGAAPGIERIYVMGPPATAIRQLAASQTGRLLAAAEFERFVHLYDLSTLERLRTLETSLDFGGRRLAISNDGNTVIAGAYHVHGSRAIPVKPAESYGVGKTLRRFNTSISMAMTRACSVALIVVPAKV